MTAKQGLKILWLVSSEFVFSSLTYK